MSNNVIPILGQITARNIQVVTLQQPDGSLLQVPAAAVVALSPEALQAVAQAVVAALLQLGGYQPPPSEPVV